MHFGTGDDYFVSKQVAMGQPARPTQSIIPRGLVSSNACNYMVADH